jgi:hypothetical protein
MNAAPPSNASARTWWCWPAARGHRKEHGFGDLQDLQEMNNQMRATIDRGMSELQSKQGQSGLPSLPPNTAGTIDSAYARKRSRTPMPGRK